ncbi:4-fold beta flower protein [Rhodococcus qingshengii]|uniref:4-fold beta flower protein n=1 Tax=Rhodococcus qingshengii TaxID=334542 RepID=UPI0037C5C4CC
MTLYDRRGVPEAYIASDLSSIYLWSGKPVAYLDSFHIYSWGGRHIGWFENGILHDARGRRVGFTSSNCPSATRLAPMKSMKSMQPMKSMKSMAPMKPMLSMSNSQSGLAEFLSARA